MAWVQVGVTIGGNIKNFQGESTEEKPTTDLGSGSSAYCVDNGDTYIWHIDQWRPV